MYNYKNTFENTIVCSRCFPHCIYHYGKDKQENQKYLCLHFRYPFTLLPKSSKIITDDLRAYDLPIITQYPESKNLIYASFVNAQNNNT